MPYEFIYYEAKSQCRLSPHTRPPWYDDMLPLPVHPLRCHRNLIDRDWDTSSQESAESINAPQAQPKHYEDVDTNATGPLSTPPRIPHP
jgi:hypothetical protein